jgi:hypothetical protein
MEPWQAFFASPWTRPGSITWFFFHCSVCTKPNPTATKVRQNKTYLDSEKDLSIQQYFIPLYDTSNQVIEHLYGNASAIDQKTFRLNPTVDNPINVELAQTFAYIYIYIVKKKKKKNWNSQKRKKKKENLYYSSHNEFCEILVFPFLFRAVEGTNSLSNRTENRRRNTFLLSFFCITYKKKKNRKLFCCVSKKQSKA